MVDNRFVKALKYHYWAGKCYNIAMTEKLTILHLNDWHSHFENYPKNQTFFQEYSETNEVIRLDIGDNIDRWHPMTDISKENVMFNF